MRKIYAIGETVLDIVFKNSVPVTAKAGGSLLNTAVSLGRSKLPVQFITEYGKDIVGNIIDTFLCENNINTEYVYKYEEGKSALALAFLDEKNNASYSFYKDYSSKRFMFEWPEIQSNDILIFGSYYGITYEIREKVVDFMTYARKRNAFILYDPNYRISHLFELEKLKPSILENFSMANIVRCSHEDMQLISNVESSDQAYQIIKDYCPIMVYTKSSDAVYLHTPSFHEKFKVKNIVPISTIGAGDNFNAGLIYGIYKRKIAIEDLPSLNLKVWKELIEIAIEFSTDVCLSYDNYISLSFAENLKVF